MFTFHDQSVLISCRIQFWTRRERTKSVDPPQNFKGARKLDSTNDLVDVSEVLWQEQQVTQESRKPSIEPPVPFLINDRVDFVADRCRDVALAFPVPPSNRT